MKETIERIFCLVLIIVLGFLAWKKLPIFFSNKGYESYQKAQYKQAADLFERALKLDPGDLKSMSWLGSTYEKMGRADKAEEQYVKVLSIDRRRPEEHLSYIRLLLERKAYDQAIAAADAAVSANPGDQNLSDARREAASQYNAVLINRAVDTFSLGRHEEAYRLLRRSQELEENYPMRDYVLGVFYMKDSRYQDACASLEKVLAKVPSFAPASKLLGSLYMDRGMFREAEEAYKKALDSDASDPLVYNDLGILYMKQERYAEALPMVQKAVELMPGDTDTLYNLASVCRDNRAFDKAEAEYRRLLTLDPGYPNVHNDLGDMYDHLGRKDEAIAEYKQEEARARARIVVNQEDFVSWSDLAHALGGQKRFDEARSAAQRAIAIAPRYRQVYLNLAHIEEVAGRFDEADRQLQKAKAIESSGFIDEEVGRVARRKRDSVDLKRTGRVRVLLKNGRSLEGKLGSQEGDTVELQLLIPGGNGNVKLPKESIERMDLE